MMTKTANTRNVVGLAAFSRNCEDKSPDAVYADVLIPTGDKRTSQTKLENLAENSKLHPLIRLKLASAPLLIDVLG